MLLDAQVGVEGDGAPARRLPGIDLAILDGTSIEKGHAPAIQRQQFLGTPFDIIDFDKVINLIRETKDADGFRYIVTPNVDHVVRLSAHGELKPYYDDAWLTLCDSKPLALLARAMPLRLPRVTGADLTANVFGRVIEDGDHIVLIAPNKTVVSRMRAQYPRLHVRAHVPPFGVGNNPAEIAKCVDFVVREKATFIFIAVGAPQSEKIAHAILQDARATGIALCIGASLEFLTGMKRRAPRWMSRAGIEWVHRLATDPRRLWRRYVFSVLPLLRLTVTEFSKRKSARS